MNNRTSLATLVPIVQKLSTPQMAFLSRFIAVGLATNRYDAESAARLAYPRAKNPKVLALQLLNRRNIRRILDLHFQRSAAETVLRDVARAVKSARRRGSNMDVLLPTLNRAVAALELYVAQERARGN